MQGVYDYQQKMSSYIHAQEILGTQQNQLF